jgi:N-sulfoglucosamine sulfohydrolase
MAGEVRKFIEDSKGRPWHLHFGFGDPHRAGRGFANDRDWPGVKPEKFDPARIRVPSFLPDTPAVRAEIAEYYQAANRLDQGVGMIMDALRATGELDNTLVIFLSDNGIPFPNAKTNLYDAGARLPLIVRPPGAKRPGLVNEAMVSWADIAPTLLDCAGVQGPGYPLHGRSFLPILEQERPAGWDEVYFSHTFHEITMYYPMRGVRTRRFKYLNNLAHPLEYPHSSDLWASATWQSAKQTGFVGKRRVQDYLHRPAEELYDIEADPDEVNNLASKPEHRATLEQLRRKTWDFRERTKDPWMILERDREARFNVV